MPGPLTAGPAPHGVLMTTGSSSKAGPTHKLVEAGITLLITLFGVIVIFGSVKAGINWGAEGPRHARMAGLHEERRIQHDLPDRG